MSRRRKRSEAQEVDTLRRWIYRAFARELYKWMAAYAPCSIPMNPASYQMIRYICINTLSAIRPDPAWSIDVVGPDAQARAQRRGPTVVLRFRGNPV